MLENACSSISFFSNHNIFSVQYNYSAVQVKLKDCLYEVDQRVAYCYDPQYSGKHVPHMVQTHISQCILPLF